jgi:hypothetical protein
MSIWTSMALLGQFDGEEKMPDEVWDFNLA